MNKCSAILKKTILHNLEECPHTNIDGWEHEGNYYCVFHMPEESKIQPGLESYPSIHEIFLKHLKHYVEYLDRENRKISPQNRKSIDLRGVISPVKIELNLLSENIHASVDFSDAVFLGPIVCGSTQIDGAFIFERVECKKNIEFKNLRLTANNGASFKNSTFFSDVEFQAGQIPKMANFSNTTFFGNVKFINTQMWQVNFTNSKFSKNIEFEGVQFHEITKLENIVFGCEENNEEKYINFFGSVFHGEVIFDNTHFNGRVNLDSVTFKNFAGFRETEFYSAPTMVNTRIEENLDFSKSKFKHGNIYTYRKIKKWMEEQRNMWEATIFYGRELLEEWRDSKWYWKIISLNTVYLIFNNYGRWWFLPIFWIIIFTVVFAVGYFIFDSFGIIKQGNLLGWENHIANYPRILQSLLFSVQNLKLSWLFGRQIMFPQSGWVWVANGIQSVINVVLFAMTIISIRKRFKI